LNRIRFYSSIAFVLFFVLSLAKPVQAQPIPPSEGVGDDTGDTSSEKTQSTENARSSSGRIIPPDEFGKFEPTSEEESELNKASIIEKLRADSASMRIRYEERIRQLRSDSQGMRARIEELRKQVRQLKQADRKEASDTESERDTSPMIRSDDRRIARMEPQSSKQSDTSFDQDQTKERKSTKESESFKEGPDSPLNPNTASLDELKSISDLSDRLAERIEWYRREVTPFDNLQDLRRVPGIDRKTFNQIQEYFHEGPY
jgi:DNA uptake protein ComE-like DNA-binding protein